MCKQNYYVIENFKTMSKLPLFEILLKDDSYDLIEIAISDNQKNFIAHSSNVYIQIIIDDVFSLDEHLQELYEQCYNGLLEQNLVMF